MKNFGNFIFVFLCSAVFVEAVPYKRFPRHEDRKIFSVSRKKPKSTYFDKKRQDKKILIERELVEELKMQQLAAFLALAVVCSTFQQSFPRA